MSTYLTTTGTGHPGAQIEEFGRLALALVLSAGAHLLLAQSLPQSVKPYEGTPSAASFTLTVSLETITRVRPKAPAAVQPPPKSDESVDGAARGDQPPLSMLAPEGPRDALPDTPLHEDRTALPLLDYYYSSREVDEPAKAVGDALLVYPREALELRVSGEVKLRLFIDEFGALVRSEVVGADPPGIFEEAALQALSGMRFSPARKGEQTVRSQRTVQITFDPDPPSLRDAQSTLSR
jgi:protein TonB